MKRQQHLVIFARFPVAGAGKRRLAADIGTIGALRFQRIRLANLLGHLARDRRWRTWLSATPDRSGPWPTHVDVLPQGTGDLGRRLARTTRRVPVGPIVIIGSDIPGIEPDDIAGAFEALGDHDVVLGPAPDGGFWLVGLRRTPRLRLPFNNVRWSTPHTLADTIREAGGSRVAHLRNLTDVDNAAALDAHPKWDRHIGRMRDLRDDLVPAGPPSLPKEL